MKIVFTWIQWCGKWTQARLLVEKYDFTLIEMWGEFRKIIESWSELWIELKKIMDAWYQVPWELWKKVMENAITSNIDKENIIFDAFVRNEWNKEIFDKLLPDYKVLFFELSVEKAKNRLLWRMFDKVTWETFPLWTTHNPKTNEELIKRDDDKDEKAILMRIQEYEEKTLPIVELQKAEWKVIEVWADNTIDQIHNEIVDKLLLS